MTMRPWRSAKWPVRMSHSPFPAVTVATITIATLTIQATMRARPSANEPASITTRPAVVGTTQRAIDDRTTTPWVMPSAIVAAPTRKMTTTDTANTGPPGPSAVDTDAAIGTLVTVAARNSRRIVLPLPEMAFADHVNCCHGSQRSANSRPASPTPVQSGWATRWPTSWEKAKTYARSKNSSTGSAVKSSVRSGTTTPRTVRG